MSHLFTLRGIIFSALFAAMFVVLSFITINVGFTPVPFTMETFAIMIAGGILGARYGTFSIGLVVLLTALGFPLLHGRGGLSLILGPTGGYIWMFPIAALLIGWIVPRIRGGKTFTFIAIFLTMEIFGSLILYITGVPWLAHVAGYTFQKAMAQGCYPYLLGDALKALAATAIVVSIRRIYPVQRLIGK